MYILKTPKGLLSVLLAFLFSIFESYADPKPGDVFREYSYNENINFMIERGIYKDSVQIEIFVDDTEDAIKFEFGASYWGGHIGTSNQRFRVNNSPKYDLPHPETPGSHYCYPRNVMGRNAVELALEHLRQGRNIITIYCGPQICYSFNWPHYIVYSAFLRVYFQPDRMKRKPVLELAEDSDKLKYNPVFRVRSKAKDDIASVDFIGKYLDYDRSGDGRFYKWHYQILNGEWLNTQNHPPFHYTKFECQWNNNWIPLEEKPVEFAAVISYNDGLKYMTESLRTLKFKLSYKVKMYISDDIPEAFDVRDGQKEECTIDIPDLNDAESAMLNIASWSGATSTGVVHEVSINGVQLADNFGVFHDFSYDMLPVPISLLREGNNIISFYSEYEGHALEVLWPGPALMVKYRTDEH